MKIVLLFVACLISLVSYSQNKDDRIIIVNLPDSANARSAIMKSLIKNDFVIKDLENRDTIITYAADMGKTIGYIVILASISTRVIKLAGLYSHKKVEYLGYNSQDKHYIPIRYYSASKTWRVLQKVAQDTGGVLSYGK